VSIFKLVDIVLFQPIFQNQLAPSVPFETEKAWEVCFATKTAKKKQLKQVLSAEKDSILGDNLPDMWHL